MDAPDQPALPGMEHPIAAMAMTAFKDARGWWHMTVTIRRGERWTTPHSADHYGSLTPQELLDILDAVVASTYEPF